MEITASVLKSLSVGGPVAMAASIMTETAVSKLMAAAAHGDDAREISGAPLAISLFDSESRALPVKNLEAGLNIRWSCWF